MPNSIYAIDIDSDHAHYRHGIEATEAIECLRKYGSKKQYILQYRKYNDRYEWLCTDGRCWYSIITTRFKVTSNFYIATLVTAYLIDIPIEEYTQEITEISTNREILSSLPKNIVFLKQKER